MREISVRPQRPIIYLRMILLHGDGGNEEEKNNES